MMDGWNTRVENWLKVSIAKVAFLSFHIGKSNHTKPESYTVFWSGSRKVNFLLHGKVIPGVNMPLNTKINSFHVFLMRGITDMIKQ